MEKFCNKCFELKNIDKGNICSYCKKIAKKNIMKKIKILFYLNAKNIGRIIKIK